MRQNKDIDPAWRKRILRLANHIQKTNLLFNSTCCAESPTYITGYHVLDSEVLADHSNFNWSVRSQK